MRLKKIILNNYYFYTFVSSVIFISILTIVFNYFFRSSMEAFTVITDNKSIQEDLDGDGERDTLYIKKDDKNYYIQINMKNSNSFSLDPNKDLPTLGDSLNHWPLRASIIDVSRDNVKEIFLQASFHGKPIQHVFTLNEKNYSDVLYTSNNILGFVDSKNNKTPKIISANIANNQILFNSYIFIKGELKKFEYNYPENYVGCDTILSFISLVQGFPNEALTLPPYIYQNISGNDINLLYQSANNGTSYTFQDGSFKDLSWDSKGLPHEIKWTLNFKSALLSDPKAVKSTIFDLILTKINNADGSFSYKITSVDLR